MSLNDNITWEVRSRLNVNMSPTSPQILSSVQVENEQNSATVAYDSITIEYSNTQKQDKEIKPIDGKAVAIKANKVIQSALDRVPAVDFEYEEDGTVKNTYYNCQLKVFSNETLKDTDNGGLNLHNYGEGKYTKLSFEDAEDTSKCVSINAIIPGSGFGLIMMHNTKISDGDDAISIRLKKASGSDPLPAIYNNRSSDKGADAWWSGQSKTIGGVTAYRLRPGINIVKIPESCEIQIYPDSTKKDVVIFSDLDIISSEAPINKKLNYKTTIDNLTVEEQILHDIREIDTNHNFYYNAMMNNDTMIDLNQNDDTDTLENPMTWYNYNNVANKFVISEIDAEYLPIGITIAKSSKL